MKYLQFFANDWIGERYGDHRVLTLHYLVNDVLMALFFAIAGKEVWEAMLPGGFFNESKKVVTFLVVTIGGMVGLVLFYLVGCMVIGKIAEYGNGWVIFCVMDIVFSYMVAWFVFGVGYSVIFFLLLLVIVDDALGFIILVVFYS